MEKFLAFLLGLAIGGAGIAFVVWIGRVLKKRCTPVVLPPPKISYKPPFVGYAYLPDEYVVKVRESTPDPDEVDDAEYEKRMKALKMEASKQARSTTPKKTLEVVERFTAANQPSPEAPSPAPPAPDPSCSADHSSGVGAGS